MADPYQALYRRYRPKRFGELRGQDHVVRALRNAVAEDRVGHAYLFSGPRGTGKTSTARILAKVLNCEHPVDGEPDGTCPNCVAVDEGRIVDWLLELDAASNNGVANIRELIERIPLGTSGQPQGRDPRRGPHAQRRRGQRAAEVARGAAGPRRLRPLHHRPAEGAAHDPEPHPALRVPPPRRRRAGRPRALRDRRRRARARRGRRRARRPPGWRARRATPSRRSTRCRPWAASWSRASRSTRSSTRSSRATPAPPSWPSPTPPPRAATRVRSARC